MLGTIGDGGYDLGARARQIRDDLLALESPDEGDMLAVQLDNRALFLERWRSFLLDLLDEEAVREEPKRGEFRDLVEETWTGHASVESTAFRLVRAFRSFVFERVYGWLTASCEAVDEGFNIYRIHQAEGPLWRPGGPRAVTLARHAAPAIARRQRYAAGAIPGLGRLRTVGSLAGTGG